VKLHQQQKENFGLEEIAESSFFGIKLGEIKMKNILV
jgi:hypothetical protein